MDNRCSIVEALEAASLHPAQSLGLEDQKGNFKPGADADLVILDRHSLALKSTWIGDGLKIQISHDCGAAIRKGQRLKLVMNLKSSLILNHDPRNIMFF